MTTRAPARRRRPRKRTAGSALLAVLVATLLWAGPARAGTYTVYECHNLVAEASGGDGYANYNAANNGAYSVANACASGAGSRWATLGQAFTAQNGAAASWNYTAPAATRFAGLSFLARPSNLAWTGSSAAWFITSPSAVTYTGLFASDGREHSYSYLGDFGAFYVRLGCGVSGGCANSQPSVSSYNFAFTLDDQASPSASTSASGLLAGGWQRGSGPVSWSGADAGSGLRQAQVTIDDSVSQTQALGCATGGGAYVRFVPCPPQSGGNFTLDTAQLSDGSHTITVKTTDAGGRQGASTQRTLRVDNTAPPPPQNLAVTGGSGNDSGWRTQNDFDLTWTQPSEPDRAPVTALRWKLDSPPAEATDGYLVSSGTPALEGVAIPTGTHVLYVWLVDEAGNASAANYSTATLRFVNAPPQASSQPAVGGGAPRVGQPIIGSPGSFSGEGTITTAYQWLRCDAGGEGCEPIPGATSLTYTPTCRDVGRRLRLRVRASNEAGTTEQRSAPTAAVPESSACAAGSGAIGEEKLDRGAPIGSPSAEDAVLTARFAGAGGKARCRQRTRRARRRCRRSNGNSKPGQTTAAVRYGETMPASGRLTTRDGRPIAGALLELQSRTKGSAAFAAAGGFVRTAGDGAWQGRIPAGPSRRVRVLYHAYTKDPTPAARADLDLRVAAKIAMRRAARSVRAGFPVSFRGRLVGGPIPEQGAIVELQGRLRGRRAWKTFKSLTTLTGRFTGGYRFLASSSGLAFQVRARVRGAQAYPYETGISRVLTVRVR